LKLDKLKGFFGFPDFHENGISIQKFIGLAEVSSSTDMDFFFWFVSVGEDVPGDGGDSADLEGTPADGTPAEIAATSAGGFVCLVCGRKFNFKTSAVRHYRTQHIAQNRVQCHVCQRFFKNKVVRNTHRAHAHGITENMMRCIVGERPSSATPSTGNMVLQRGAPLILKRNVVEIKREDIEK